MVPSALVIPAVLPPGVLGALLGSSGILTVLGAVAAVVGIGLCVAIARADAAASRSGIAVVPSAPPTSDAPAVAA